MRVLMLHNVYRYRGGEDAAVESESRVLERQGVEVIRPEFDNSVAGKFPILGAFEIAAKSAWSHDSYEKVRKLCEYHRPDVVHVHNFWMRLSPAVHAAAQDCGVPTVQSLHNHRLSCVNGMLLRDGKQCEDCLGNIPWRGVLHRCQHGSLLQSAAVARMIVLNRRWHTWQDQVDAFITPSQFARSRVIAGGIPTARTFVKPNAACDPGESETPASSCSTAVFAGRLSEEKGIAILLDAWAMAGRQSGRRLLIVGDGPARGALESRALELGFTPPQVVFTGWKPSAEVRTCLMNARFFVLPSLCGETFGTSVVEAFANARPAIVTSAGGQGEIVQEAETGLKVPPGDAPGLASAMDALYSDDQLVSRMGQQARGEYLARYTPEQSYRKLMQIYEFAMSRSGVRSEGVAC
jgi:glycosyltransferase involved in cell wall biosynthesis